MGLKEEAGYQIGREVEQQFDTITKTQGLKVPLMSEAVCPICKTSIPIEARSAFVLNQIRCTGCGTLLEILDRTTLELGEVQEDWGNAVSPYRQDRAGRSAKGAKTNSGLGRRNAKSNLSGM